MKTKAWILLIAALFAACLLLSICFLLPGEAAAFAQVWSDGQLLYTLDLGKDQSLTVNAQGGCNEITVRDGKIAVTQANCPDGYCMDRGWCSGGTQIVCLPNRLVIRFTGQQPIDGISG